MGLQVYQLMEETYGYYLDEELQAWVEGIGKRLEEQLEGGYKFQYFITDQEDLNAFATAGGYVFVTRGLLALVSSDDELAGVLAHEISHVTEKHASKTNRASILPAILEIPANIIGLITYSEVGDILNIPIELTSDLALSAYSRSQERDADKLGADLAYRAGYDPYKLIHALEKLEAFSETAYQVKDKKSWFNDHPMTTERAKYLNDLLSQKGISPTEIKSGSNIMAQDGLLFGQNPRKALINGNEVVHLRSRFYMKFPEDFNLNSSNSSLTAVSSDGKSSIIIMIDSLTNQPEMTAQLELSQLNNVTVLDEGKLRINGLEAYKASLEQSRVKYPDLNGEIIWVKNSISGVMIRIVAIHPINKSNENIQEAISSLRLFEWDEISDWNYLELDLREEGKLEYLKESNARYVEALQVLNDLEKDEYQVDEGRQYKVLKMIPLSEYQP